MLTRVIGVVAAAIMLMLSSMALAAGEVRVALVIGNSQYENAGSLKNPRNDAEAISGKLQSIGFDVTEGFDLNYDALRDTIRAFASKTRNADLTVVYYAGHGVSIDNVNYMVPIDAQMNDPVDWEFEVFALEDMLRVVERSKGPSLVFLDACRDNPLAHTLSAAQGMSSRSMNTRGLSRIARDTLGTSGSVVAYATEPGQVAADGEGKNSPFTTALLRHIGAPNTDFATLTSLITRDVLELTDNVQRPRFDVSLTGPLVINPVATLQEAPVETVSLDQSTPEAEPVAPTGAASLEVEKIMFQTAADTGDAADYRAYLDLFPQGAFAALARNAIARQAQAEEKQETELAALDQTGANENQFRMLAAPLMLNPQPVGLAMVSSQATETELNLNRPFRREVQIRLNLSGNNVGSADGIIGNGTRRGISAWQSQNGFAATGYLNAVQHQMLTANTQAQFQQHMAANPTALNPPVRTSSTKSRPATKKKKQKKKQNNNQIGAFIGGVAAGILLSK